VPAFTKTSSGCVGADVKIGEPHSGQKWRVSSRPLSARFVKPFGTPDVIRRSARRSRTPTLNALPVQRRQSSQWQ